jgi:hypothetical protein
MPVYKMSASLDIGNGQAVLMGEKTILRGSLEVVPLLGMFLKRSLKMLIIT